MKPNPPPVRPGEWTPSNRPEDPRRSPLGESGGTPGFPDFSLPGFTRVSRSGIASYSKTLRGCDQAVLGEFKDIFVWLPNGEKKPVPIIIGPPEKAVAVALQESVDKKTIRIDAIKLPMMALSLGDVNFAPERFTYHQNVRWLLGDNSYAYGSEKRKGDTVYGMSRGLPVDKHYILHVWTRYVEDMNQIAEQIMLKFSPVLTLYVPDVLWEVVAKLDAVSNGISNEIGDSGIKIVKFEFSFHAETYISRGFIRGKTVFDFYGDLHLQTRGELDHMEGGTIGAHATEAEIEKLNCPGDKSPGLTRPGPQEHSAD